MIHSPLRAGLALDPHPARLLRAGLPLLTVNVGSLSRGLITPNIRGTAPSLPIAESALEPGVREGVAFEVLLEVLRDTQEDTIKRGHFPVVGRLSHFLEPWRERDHPRWVDPGDHRERYVTRFLSCPPVSRCPLDRPLPALEAKRTALWTEVQLLLNIAIEEVDPGTGPGGGGGGG